MRKLQRQVSKKGKNKQGNQKNFSIQEEKETVVGNTHTIYFQKTSAIQLSPHM